MKVVVLGAGVVGTATAYFLAEDGHEVTVLDRQPAPGRATKARFTQAHHLVQMGADTEHGVQ